MSLRDKISASRQKNSERKAGNERLYKFKNGKTRFRFVAGKRNPEDFFRDYGLHWIKDAEGNTTGAVGDRSICYEGEACMIRQGLIEMRSYANKIGDPKIEELANDMMASPRVVANILVVEGPGDQPDSIVMADFTNTTFYDHVLSAMEDVLSDNDNDPSCLFGDDAVVFSLEKTGSGLKTSYSVNTTTKTATLPEGAMDSATDIDNWIAAQFDVSRVAQATKAISEHLGRPMDDSVIEGALTAAASTAALEDKRDLKEELDDEIPLHEGSTDDSSVTSEATADDEVEPAVDPSTVAGGEDLMADIDAL